MIQDLRNVGAGSVSSTALWSCAGAMLMGRCISYISLIVAGSYQELWVSGRSKRCKSQKELVFLHKEGRSAEKPVLVSWLGERYAKQL